MPFFLEWRNRPGLPGMATRKPSLGLTHHTYNRLQAGCYLTIDLDFKDHKSVVYKRQKISFTLAVVFP
jgi:hypothetical protein